MFRLDLLARGVSLTFSNGSHEYVIEESLDRATQIHVSKAQRPLASITCESATDTLTSTTTMRKFEQVRIYER